jgi:VIT1/CCC1 family predicted Fe2+/Mn2+ transporter
VRSGLHLLSRTKEGADQVEEVPTSRLYISALTIGLSYFLGGLIPLLPYLFATSAEQGLIISCIVTGVVLLLFGAFKTYFT